MGLPIQQTGSSLCGEYTSFTSIALVLLYSGGLMALQNAMIVAALPFSVIMILMTISLFKSLNKETKQMFKKHIKR